MSIVYGFGPKDSGIRRGLQGINLRQLFSRLHNRRIKDNKGEVYRVRVWDRSDENCAVVCVDLIKGSASVLGTIEIDILEYPKSLNDKTIAYVMFYIDKTTEPHQIVFASAAVNSGRQRRNIYKTILQHCLSRMPAGELIRMRIVHAESALALWRGDSFWSTIVGKVFRASDFTIESIEREKEYSRITLKKI